MIAVLLATVLVAAPIPQSVDLNVGQQQVVELGNVQRVAVGDASIADVKPLDARQLLIVGKSEGQTTLLVWLAGRNGSADTLHKLELHVSKQNGEALSQALEKLIPGADLSVSLINGKRVVQGQVLTLDDLRRLTTLVAGESDVVLMVNLDRSGQARVVARINAEFQKAGLTDAKAEQVGDEIFLEGHVDDARDAHKAQLIAESFTGGPVSTLP